VIVFFISAKSNIIYFLNILDKYLNLSA